MFSNIDVGAKPAAERLATKAKCLQVMQKYGNSLSPEMKTLVASLESELGSSSYFRKIESNDKDGLDGTNSPTSKAALLEKFSVYDRLVNSGGVDPHDVEDLRAHFNNLKDTLDIGMDNNYSIAMRGAPAGFASSASDLNDVIVEINLLGEALMDDEARRSVTTSLNYYNWNLNISENEISFQRVTESIATEKVIDREAVKNIIGDALFLMDEVFSDKWSALFEGLTEKLKGANILSVRKDKINRLLYAIEYQLINLAYELLTHKLSIVHRYLLAYQGKLDTTPIYRIKDTANSPATGVTRLVTSQNIENFERKRLTKLTAAMESLEPVSGLLDEADQLLSVYGNPSLESEPESRMAELRGKVELLESLIPNSPWGKVVSDFKNTSDSWVSVEGVSLSLESHPPVSIYGEEFFIDGTESTFKGFVELHAHVTDISGKLSAACESLVEGDAEPLSEVCAEIRGTEIPTLPYGLSLRDGVLSVSTESEEVEQSAYPALKASLTELYSSGLNTYRSCLSEAVESLESLKTDFGTTEAETVASFLTMIVPYFEESLEELTRSLIK